MTTAWMKCAARRGRGCRLIRRKRMMLVCEMPTSFRRTKATVGVARGVCIHQQHYQASQNGLYSEILTGSQERRCSYTSLHTKSSRRLVLVHLTGISSERKTFGEEEQEFTNPLGEWGIKIEGSIERMWERFLNRNSYTAPEGCFEDGSEHRWTAEGLPVVRRKLSYAELLSDIRDDKVKEIVRWESIESRGQSNTDQRCLVVYKDRSLAKSKVPSEMRLFSEAMRIHNVRQVRLMMDPIRLKSRVAEPIVKKVDPAMVSQGINPQELLQGPVAVILSGVSLSLIIGVIGWLKYQEYSKGDFGDRLKMKLQDQKDKMQRRMRLELGAKQSKFSTEELDALIKKAADGDKEASEKLSAAQSPDLDSETDRFLTFTTVKFQPAVQRADREQLEKEKLEARELRRKSQLEAKDRAEATNIIGKLGQRLSGRGAPSLKKSGRVYFDDVAGIGSAKAQLEEIVDFFVRPEIYYETGSRRPRGILMTGPPGTGKTLMARAVAGEAGVAFFSCNASEFVEIYVGVGASRIRDLFKQAEANQPAVIFIDELDALGRERQDDAKQQERNQTLNQLLVSLDGMAEKTDVVVIAATNRPDILDQALVRPGRFDRKVTVGNADQEGRKEILQVHIRDRPYDEEDIDLNAIAKLTVGFSGARLAALVNQSALEAARKSKDRIEMEDLELALSMETNGRVLDVKPREDRLRRVAIRMCASSVVAQCSSLAKYTLMMSIESKERAPDGEINIKYDDDKFNTMVLKKRDYMEAMMYNFAGHVAEEVFYGYNDITMMNIMDLERARELARNIVYINAVGETPSIRNRSILFYGYYRGELDEQPLAYENYKMPQNVKDDAENEITALLKEAREKCRIIVERNRDCIIRLSEELLLSKVLNAGEIYDIFKANADKLDIERNRDLVVPRVKGVKVFNY